MKRKARMMRLLALLLCALMILPMTACGKGGKETEAETEEEEQTTRRSRRTKEATTEEETETETEEVTTPEETETETESETETETPTPEPATEAPAEGLVGVFKIVRSTGDPELTEEDMKAFEDQGMVAYIHFLADGTYVSDILGTGLEGTWNDTTIRVTGLDEEYELNGDELIIYEEKDTIYMVRTTMAEINRIKYGMVDEGSILVDTDELTLTLDTYEMGGFWDFVGKVTAVNHTSDRTFGISFDTGSVNGYQLEIFGNFEAAPGETVQDDFSFDLDEVERVGITSVDKLVMGVWIYDTEDFSTVFQDVITLYPTGKTDDEIEIPEPVLGDGAKVIMEDDDVVVALLDAEKDEYFGMIYHIYLENKTEKTLMFDWEDVTVNGEDCDPYWADEVLPLTSHYANIYFDADALKEIGVEGPEDLTELGFRLIVYDAYDFTGGYMVDEAFTYEP